MRLISQYLATADQLDTYVDEHRDADSLLPEIVERLVKASLSAYQDCRFPNGRAILSGGWDGRVDSGGADPYVPAGVSGWELTVREDQRAKAEEDYASRVASLGAAERAAMTFVHWNMRKWTKASEWATERRTDGEWGDVRAYDAVYLASWLCDHPAVHIWVTRRIGKSSPGVQDVRYFWRDWAGTPRPPFTPKLVLHGYEAERDTLVSVLARGESYTTVQWERPELALGFIAAALAHPRNAEEERLAVRAVHVHTQSALEDLVDHHENLILVPSFVPKSTGIVRERGHQLVVPLGRGADDRANIQLRSRQPSVIEEAMLEWEPDRDRRAPLAAKASTKFFAFYRGLLHDRARPEWASRDALSLLLAGRWNGRYAGDREIIAKLTGRPYEEAESYAISLHRNEDPLIRRTGQDFSVVDEDEAWFFLGRFLDDAHLDLLEEAVLTVFGEADPQYAEGADAARVGMSADRMGAIRYSLSIRQGLADALCYLGANGAEFNAEGVRDGAVAAAVGVRRLFEEASGWREFCSLAPSFSRLAEAAPDEFLTSIEEALKERSDKVVSLFRDKEGEGFFGSNSPHTYLLWALELLMWSPEHLGRASLALSRLARLDPGGRTGNRPLSSLTQTFLTWNPSTLATHQDRKLAIERIARAEPTVFWPLICSLLPDTHGVSFPGHEARHRPWGRLWQTQPTYGDVWQAVDDVCELAIDTAGPDPHRWTEIVADVPYFRDEGFDLAIAKLLDVPAAAQSPTDLDPLRERTREVAAKHRSFPEAEWSMPSERLRAFERVLDALAPSSTTAKWRWVFGSDAMYQLGEGRDFNAKFAQLAEMRKTAATEIVRDDGLPSLLGLAGEVTAPWLVGEALGATPSVGDDLNVLTAAVGVSKGGLEFAQGYAEAKRRNFGDEWVWALLDSEWGRGQSASVRARLAKTVGIGPHSLDRVDSLEAEVRDLYWIEAGGSGLVVSQPELVGPVVERLVQHGAIAGAIKTLAFRSYEEDPAIAPELALHVLERAVEPDAVSSVAWGDLQHDVSVILDYLDARPDADVERLARLEFILVRFLSQSRSPKALNRLVSNDPSGFVLLLRAVFRSRKEGVDESENRDELPPPALAYEILGDLRSLPGQGDDGAIDGGKLRGYVDEVRRLADEVGRLGACDERLGQWFSRSPAGADGLRPPEAVREVFEHLESERFEQGYEIGLFNDRGVVTKGQEEGGRQERDLADQYRETADRLRGRWPRTARALQRLADSYTRDARREDQRHGAD